MVRRLGLVLALAVFAGCGAPTPPASIADRDWTAAELLASVRSRADSLETLRAGLELAWPDPDTGERKSCGASLSYARSDRLRIRATTKAFFTVFDLVATEERVWLEFPSENFVIFGERDDPAWDEFPLAPDALLVALLADPCAASPCDEPVELGSQDAETRSIVGPGWTLALDRRTGLPLRYDRPGGDGLHISWNDWGMRGARAWPFRIGVRVGDETRELEVRLGRLQPGKPIRDSTFSLDPDEGREVLTPAEARGRWERVRL